MNGEPIIIAERVRFAYDREPALLDVSLAIQQGDFACMIGPNGGGKSTLLKLIAGLLEPTAGSLRVFGSSPSRHQRRFGYLPQHARLDSQFPVTVEDVVLMGRLPGMGSLGFRSKQDLRVASDSLAAVELAGFERRRFAALSGGQRQRVLIARALACEPDVLLLDEPTSNLDIRAEEHVYRLLRDLNERLTIVMVSHDVGFVSKYVKTAICVNRKVHTHTSAEVSGEVIQELYGRQVRRVHLEHPEAPHAAEDA